MVVCAWNLCRKFARTRLTGMFSIAMSCIVQCTSNQLRAFWSLSSSWFQKSCKRISWLSDLILGQEFLTTTRGCSVGALRTVNCLKKIRAAIMAKKNTQICRLSVGCGATNGLRLEYVIISIVAGSAKLVNHFASRNCYV